MELSPEAQAGGRPLLRFITAGSVDDGKSTLIGRLLYDSKTLLQDQLESLQATSERRGEKAINLALVTDGLRAEREQGITIDVAYRYFSTPRRKFIIVDAPGHVEYTRNMVTGASNADLAVVLVDARLGIMEQTKRHVVVCSLLGIQHIVFAINKMDLVGYSESRFLEIASELSRWAAKLSVGDVSFLPLSALSGDNVVDRSPHMPWYKGAPLLYLLETIHTESDANRIDGRFPVQWVVRPEASKRSDYRGLAGNVASGSFRLGDSVVVLPKGTQTEIAAIDTFDGPLEQADTDMAVTIRLRDDVDVSRGDMICRVGNQPDVVAKFDCMVAWLGDQPLREGTTYAIKHATRWVMGRVTRLHYLLDVNSLHREKGPVQVDSNELARVSIETSAPLCVDAYKRNRKTGALLLVDVETNQTVGAGMILAANTSEPAPGGSVLSGLALVATSPRSELVASAGALADSLGLHLVPFASLVERNSVERERRDIERRFLSGLDDLVASGVYPVVLTPFGWRGQISKGGSLGTLIAGTALGVVLLVTRREDAESHAILALEAMDRDGACVQGWMTQFEAGNGAEDDQLRARLRARMKHPYLGTLEGRTVVLDPEGRARIEAALPRRR